MPLVDNIDTISSASKYPVDKIVGVYEGSFNNSSDTTTRSGAAGSIKVFSIAHGFTRPVFTHLLFSDDNSNWADGGSTASTGGTSIAFSDSSNVYIVAAKSTGTTYYKVILEWIDNYDSSNPSVDSFTADNKPFQFDSRANYQKIYEQGTTTYSPGTFGSTGVVTITHSLGYIPNAKVFFEPISGEVWPLVAGGASNPFTYSFTQDEGYMQIYSNRVDVTVLRFSNATRNIWYRIYLDE